MKTMYLALFALLLPHGAFAQAGELPEGFSQAIQHESAGDRGVDIRADEEEDLPAGFAEAIVDEAENDQPPATPARKKKTALTPKERKDLIRKIIRFNEIYGVEAPMTVADCAESSESESIYKTCLQLLEHRASVLSSRHTVTKKQFIPQTREAGKNDSSLIFDAE